MFKRILLTLDGSELAEQIVPHVMDIARQNGATIFLLRVALAHNLPGMDATESQVRVVKEAEEYIARMQQQLSEAALNVKSAVRYGHDAEEILDHLDLNDIDLVAMSTHGRSGVRRWVLGSVAEKVLRHAMVPVLLFRVGAKKPKT